jgi:predicted Zn-dependent peptidase
VADRSRLPAVGADAPFVFPAIRKTRLPNGLDVWSVEHGTLPISTMVLLVRAGSSADPEGRPGLASLTGDMLDEGAGDRDALGVHDALARIGAQFDTEVGPDATFLTLTTLGRFRPTGLRLLTDMVRRPRFDEGEFERVRQLRANRLRQLRDIPSATADRAFASALYGRHPYGHLAIGTIDALATMTLGEVRALHRRAYRPGRVVLVVVGGAPHAQVVDEIAEAFADWIDPPDQAVTAPGIGSPAPPAERMWMVERAGAAQSEIRLGHIGVSRTTPAYHALLLVNLVLGGQFVSRLNMNLREHRGYTYGARSWFEFRLGPGPFQMSASVQTEVTAAAMREAISEMTGIASDRPITASELDTARATLTRGYPRNFETTDQMARSIAQLALYDLDDDYFAAFVPRVAGLPLDVVRSAAAEHLHPDQLTAVVVGDTARVAPTLEPLGLGVPRTLEVP